MALNLIELIRAKGGSGASGQTFKIDVAEDLLGIGFTTGVGVRSFVLGGASWSGTTPQPPVEITYSNGHTFSGIVGTFSQFGGNFPLIQRTGTAPWSLIGIGDGLINSATWNTGLGTVTLSVTVYGEYDDATLPTLTAFVAWFTGYSSPSMPAGVGAEDVVIAPQTGGGGAASGSDPLSLRFQYDPDTADFNPALLSDSWNLQVARRAWPSWNTMFEWELHGSDSYAGTIANSYSSETTDFEVTIGYARYRRRAEYNGGSPGAWTNYGAVVWTDPRDDV